eukprot:COSAG01_NODE_53618_length_338_cov_0.397490_1_plen_41_part_01
MMIRCVHAPVHPRDGRESAAIGWQWVRPPRHGDPIINHLSS